MFYKLGSLDSLGLVLVTSQPTQQNPFLLVNVALNK